MTDLRQAAQAVVERWDSPKWEWSQQGPTADLMASLRTALEQQAEPVAVYGYCPDCGAKGVTRERRPNGDDKCTNGHTYPSSTATPVQPLLMNHNGAVRKVHGYPPQQQAEPVAWQVMVEDEAMKEFPIKDMAYDWCIQQKLSGSSYVYWMRPLYTTPPQRQWVGLTDEDFLEACQIAERGNYLLALQRIQIKLKEKNT